MKFEVLKQMFNDLTLQDKLNFEKWVKDQISNALIQRVKHEKV